LTVPLQQSLIEVLFSRAHFDVGLLGYLDADFYVRFGSDWFAAAVCSFYRDLVCAFGKRDRQGRARDGLAGSIFLLLTVDGPALDRIDSNRFAVGIAADGCEDDFHFSIARFGAGAGVGDFQLHVVR
jgi:hypothetical protein